MMDEGTVWYLFSVISSAQAIALMSIEPLKRKYGDLSYLRGLVNSIGSYGTSIKATILRLAFTSGMRNIFSKINSILPDDMKLTPGILFSDDNFADWDYEFVSSFWINAVNPSSALGILKEAQDIYKYVHNDDGYYFSRRCEDLLDLLTRMRKSL